MFTCPFPEGTEDPIVSYLESGFDYPVLSECCKKFFKYKVL